MVRFYVDACNSNENAVWKNLKKCHYRNDLKLPSEVVVEDDVKSEELPRYTLSLDNEKFEQIFACLNSENAEV